MADRLCGFRDAQAMLLCNLISLTVGRGCDLLLVMKYMSKVCDKMCVIMWMIQYVMCIDNYDARLTRTFFTGFSGVSSHGVSCLHGELCVRKLSMASA